ncbi:hypothetical protein ACL9RF_05235 [Sphingobacterium sp. Mn56C]|uniref:hypothetical protein n=1 Tax=Sphingobacterium sp. Mn56C TaxID=3395261 RepID=UPI003BE21F8E
MKTKAKQLVSYTLKFGALLIMLYTASSCKRSSESDPLTITEEGTVLVKIDGVDERSENIQLATKASSGILKEQPPVQTTKLKQGNGFDMVSMYSENNPNLPIVSGSNQGLSASLGNKAVLSLSDTIKYRIYFFRKEGNEYKFEKSEYFNPGSERPIVLQAGATYKWAAISFSSKTEPPQYIPNQPFRLPGNRDILYTNSTTDLVVENTPSIRLTFKHLFARLDLEINTKGLFAPATAATVTVTGLDLRTANFNLLDGTYSGSLLTVPQTVNFSTFVPNSVGDVRKAHFYTAGNTQQSLKISMTGLKVKLDDNTTIRDFGTSVIEETFNFTPVGGKYHHFLIAPVESPLTFESVQWSRANLYLDSINNPGNHYRFFHTNEFNSTSYYADSYFSFKGHIPRKLASGIAADQRDPCALVYPAGLWRTPTADELNKITNRSGLLGNLLGNITDLLGIGATPGAEIGPKGLFVTSRYIQFTPTEGVSSYYGDANSGTNKLRFVYNGVMQNVSLVQGLINLNLGGSYGNNAAFWTREEGINLLGIAGIGAWSFSGYSAGVTRDTPVGAKSVNLLNIDLLGLNLVASSLMNVRCVRDATWQVKHKQPGYKPDPVYINK